MIAYFTYNFIELQEYFHIFNKICIAINIFNYFKVIQLFFFLNLFESLITL